MMFPYENKNQSYLFIECFLWILQQSAAKKNYQFNSHGLAPLLINECFSLNLDITDDR